MIIANFKLHIAYFKALLILLFCLPANVNAQKLDINRPWTNGIESLYPEKLNDTVLFFFAGNLHEGWFAFCLNLKKLDSFGLYHGGDSCSSDLVKSVKLRVVNGFQILFVKDTYETDAYRPEYPREGLGHLFATIKINHELAGKYINPANGKIVVFHPDKPTVSGLTKFTEYEFEDEYDQPSDIITFENKQSYYFDVTEKGLDVFIAKKASTDADWGKGKKVMTLVKTEWLNTDSLKNTPGKYPFASKEFLIDGILSCYSSTKLALMRNEIYARHGLIFKSETLRKYFSSQSWYKPLSEDVGDKLSELEKLNIQLIQRYEVKVKEEEAMRKRDGW